MPTKAAPFTYEDFCVLVRDDQKADLINGVIYLASPETTDTNELFVWLMCFFSSFVENNDLGRVYASRVAFRLDDQNAPEPDIAFVGNNHLHRVNRDCVHGPPDLAVEIVSPDSIDRDYNPKRQKYEVAGVAEYWIIDEIEETVTLLRLGADGKYHEVKPRKGEYHSSVLKGFWLRPEWLFHTPRPRKLDALRMILDRLN